MRLWSLVENCIIGMDAFKWVSSPHKMLSLGMDTSCSSSLSLSSDTSSLGAASYSGWHSSHISTLFPFYLFLFLKLIKETVSVNFFHFRHVPDWTWPLPQNDMIEVDITLEFMRKQSFFFSCYYYYYWFPFVTFSCMTPIALCRKWKNHWKKDMLFESFVLKKSSIQFSEICILIKISYNQCRISFLTVSRLVFVKFYLKNPKSKHDILQSTSLITLHCLQKPKFGTFLKLIVVVLRCYAKGKGSLALSSQGKLATPIVPKSPKLRFHYSGNQVANHLR